jgi:hypothetical protein
MVAETQLFTMTTLATKLIIEAFMTRFLKFLPYRLNKYIKNKEALLVRVRLL